MGRGRVQAEAHRFGGRWVSRPTRVGSPRRDRQYPGGVRWLSSTSRSRRTPLHATPRAGSARSHTTIWCALAPRYQDLRGRASHGDAHRRQRTPGRPGGAGQREEPRGWDPGLLWEGARAAQLPSPRMNADRVSEGIGAAQLPGRKIERGEAHAPGPGGFPRRRSWSRRLLPAKAYSTRWIWPFAKTAELKAKRVFAALSTWILPEMTWSGASPPASISTSASWSAA